MIFYCDVVNAAGHWCADIIRPISVFPPTAMTTPIHSPARRAIKTKSMMM